MANTPLTLAETASVFGEMLTFRALLAEARTTDERRFLLAGKVEDMLNTVVRQTAFHDFETRVHGARRNGELTAEALGEIWLAVQRESLGPTLRFDEGYRHFWAYIPHFIHTPFYVYAYAFGDCLVNSLYEKYQEATDKDDFKAKYINLLKQGGSVPQADALKPFGLDMNDPSFWDAGMKEIEKLIDRLEVEMKNEAALKPRTDSGPSPTGP
jgi:oligoendopeptidase F